jgi:uncharacterized repeat protein (TIGR01451 family)
MNHFKKIPHVLAVALLCGALIFTGVYLVTSPAPKATAANTPAAVTLTPAEATNPVKTQHTLTAAVTDASGDPVADTEVEWILNRFPDAVGDIVQVSNGDKVDNFYAVSTTNSAGEATVTITATRPGDTDVTAFVPAITDETKHKVFAVKHWVDVDVDWPDDDINKIGTDHVMTVSVFKASDGSPLAGIDITWTITDDDPNARFQGLGSTIDTTTSVTDAAGEATITLQQVTPEAGENTVQIQVSQAGTLLFQHDAVKRWLSPSLDVTKTGPTTAEVGTNVTFNITVTNDGDESATGVTAVEQIPAGFTYVSAAGAPATVSGSTVTYDLGTMATGDISRVTVTLQATQKGDWTNRVSVTSLEGASAFASADIQVTGQAVLGISKTGTASLEQGQQATYTIIVGNTGKVAAENTVVTDTIPTGMSYDSSSPAGTVSGSTVTWNVGNLAIGATSTITLVLNADDVGTFTNLVEATATDTASVQATAATEVTAPPPPLVPDISITKTGVTLLYINESGDFTITVTNNGEVDLTGVTVTDTIPTNLTYVASSPAGTVSGKTITWNIGNLALGASSSITLTCMGNAVGNYTNTAAVTCDEGVSDTATASGEVTAKSGVTMQITDTVDPVVVGNTTVYQITVTNQGLIAIHNAGLSVELPASVSYVTSTGPSTATVSGQTVTYAPLASLGAGTTVTFTVTVTGDSAGDVLCRATLTYDEFSLPISAEEGTTIYTP